MKNSRLLRITSTCLALGVFACMAMASGSDTKKESSAVTIKDQGTSAAENQQAAEVKEETTTVAEDEIKYEVTHTYFTHHTNSINREEYTGIVEITNTGNTYLYLGDCKFDFEDDSGHLLESDSFISYGPDIVAPGEKGYFFQSMLLDEGISLDNGINLVPVFTIEVAKNGAEAYVDYPVSDLDLRNEKYGGMKVTGRISNNTSEETNSIDVKIIVVFFDSNGDILDVAHTYGDPMGPGSTTSFEISTLLGNETVKAEDVANYTVIARKTSLFNF